MHRLDLIHYKLFALVESGTGKHLQDLVALEPDAQEMRAASLWCLTQKDTPVFRAALNESLRALHHETVA
jgi:hypothetical protein